MYYDCSYVGLSYNDSIYYISHTNYDYYYIGHTNTAEGLYDMRTEIFDVAKGNRPDVRDVAIIITDGNSDEPMDTLSNSTAAKQDNITLFVVGITNKMRESELKGIASLPTDERYFNSVDEAHLNLLLTDLVMYVCSPTNTHAGENSIFL